MHADIAERRRVWLALSDMFLDTDTALSRAWRVSELARSPYSLAELEDILVHEVYPVCSANLRSVAGEWAGFDADWLEQRILALTALGQLAPLDGAPLARMAGHPARGAGAAVKKRTRGTVERTRADLSVTSTP